MKEALKEISELLKELMLIGLIVALAILWAKATQSPTKVFVVEQQKTVKW